MNGDSPVSEKYPPVADPLFRMWVATHASLWSQTQEPIGLSPEEIAQYADLQHELADSWQRYTAAQAEMRKAHDDWQRTKARVRAVTMEDIGAIRRFAAASANPSTVYNNAAVPAPKERTPGREPGRPTRLRAALKSQGGDGGWSVVLRWDCQNPKTTAGTVYTVERSVNEGEWVQAGIVSRRSYTDTEAPAGALLYRVTALRSGLVGLPSGAIAVRWGGNSAGEEGAGEIGGTSVKMAA